MGVYANTLYSLALVVVVVSCCRWWSGSAIDGAPWVDGLALNLLLFCFGCTTITGDGRGLGWASCCWCLLVLPYCSGSVVCSTHSCHGIGALVGACDNCPLFLGPSRPMSATGTWHRTVSNRAMIGFIGLSFWTLWNCSLIPRTVRYPQSTVLFSYVAIINLACYFGIQYYCGLTKHYFE